MQITKLLYALLLGVAAQQNLAVKQPGNMGSDQAHPADTRDFVDAMQNGNITIFKTLFAQTKSWSKEDYTELLFLLLGPSNIIANLTPEQLQKQVAIIDLLVNAGADVNKTHSDETPLSLAIAHSHLPLIRYFITNGALVNAPNNQPLMRAIMHNNLAVIKMLVGNGALINQPEVTTHTYRDVGTITQKTYPLTLAIERSTPEIITYLLDHEADVNVVGGVPGMFEVTPLGMAVMGGLEDIALLLIKKGAKLENVTKKLAPNPDITQEQSRIFLGQPLILMAAYALMPKLLTELIKRGVQATTKSAQGMTVLHFACYKKGQLNDPTAALSLAQYETKLTSIIKIALKNGVQLNAQDNDGNTALHYVIGWAWAPKCIYALLDFKPDPTIKNKLGKTPIDLAREQQQLPVDSFSSNALVEEVMDRAGNRNWPTDEQIHAAHVAKWNDIIKRLEELTKK